VMTPFSPIAIPVLSSIMPESPADVAGLQAEDKIISVNGEKISYWHQFTELVKLNPNTALSIGYERNGVYNEASITPNKDGIIGVTPAFPFEVITKEYSLLESIKSGAGYGYDVLGDYVAQFKYVFTKKGATQVGGFGAIGNLFPDTWNWLSFWQTTAFISIILAFMNILPIPALDGGHVMFLLYEMVSGRKPNEKVMEYAQIAGFFLLIALVLFANGNDVYRWIFG